MAGELAPQYEAFIQDALAAGAFPSREKLLEAAVESLREQQNIPMVPEEHMAAVEEGLEDEAAGRVTEFTDADWERYRQIARDAATQPKRA